MKHTILMERDGHNHYIHGLVIIPDGFDLAQVYRDAMDQFGEDWTYSDILNELESIGITVIKDFDRFYEEEAY